ncbi:IS630 family transposase [Streptomyces chartreusis]
MGRRPSVFVRPVSMEEGRKLQRISRTAKDPVRLRRAVVVLMSAQGQTVKDITTLMQVGEDYVRDVIHAFNERGFDALDPKWSGGRPRTISDEVREHICLIARTSPADWKITAFSTWSLSKLAEHLIKQKVTAAISRETLRRILREGKVSWKTTTTWKASTDPEFIAKMHRILALYDTSPTDGRVICVDEFGPLNLMPRKGKAWGPVRRPRRLRATYNRYGGVMHMLAALDLATGKIYYRIPKRTRWREFLGLLKSLRARWPGEKLYVVLDNFSPHKRVDVRTWTTDNGAGVAPADVGGDGGVLLRCRTGLPANLWIMAELDRGRVRGLRGCGGRCRSVRSSAGLGQVHSLVACPVEGLCR